MVTDFSYYWEKFIILNARREGCFSGGDKINIIKPYANYAVSQTVQPEAMDR